MGDLNIWNNYKDLDPELKKELDSLSDAELKEAFHTSLSFGTGGMRGVMGVGINRMNIYTLRKANYGYGKFILKYHQNPSVVIAYDNRLNSHKFALESANVLASMGIKVFLFKEITPTPVLSFAVRYLKSSGGVVITASHNPPKYNGFKVYDSDGCQLIPKLADEVIEYTNEVVDLFNIRVDDLNKLFAKGLISYLDNEIYDAYLERLKQISLNPNLDKNDFRIVFTPLHGTGAKLGLKLLQDLHYEIYPVTEQMISDPYFTTVKSPNPEEKSAFDYAIKYAKMYNADICIATDPDSDRMGVVIPNGSNYELLSGNEIGAIMLYYLVQNRKNLNNNVMFNTIVTSSIGEVICKSYGIEVVSTLTGFKFIGEQAKLLENTNKKFFFGYEESYGYVVEDFVRDKDALQSLLLISEISNYYKKQGKNLLDVLAEIYQKYGYFKDELISFNLDGISGIETINNVLDEFRNNQYQSIINIKVICKEDYLLSKRITNNVISEITLPKSNVIKYYLEDGSWFALRPSGTEPKMKAYISVVDKEEENAINKINLLKQYLVNLVRKVGNIND